MPLLEIFGNILIPALSGIFLFIYFLYFVFIEESKSLPTKFFIVFLISFGFFLFGRPIQILSGPHPVPLIINNIRSFVFSAVTIPMVILADFSQPEKNRKSQAWFLIFIGSFLGALYCLFNTLTTTGSGIIFKIGSVNVYDSITPGKTAPFYGREVTLGVYLILATFLFIDSVGKIRRAGKYRIKGEESLKKVFLYNTGKIIFALTFFLGSLLQQWWIYYVGSLFSVFFLGYGVAQNITENRRRMDKVIAYIREDLFQDLAIDVRMHQQVSDMLALLNIPKDINTFIALKESATSREQRTSYRYIDDTLKRETAILLEKTLGKNQFILMPMGTDMLGICLFIPSKTDFGRAETIAICEYLKNSLDVLNHYDFGIGQSYSSLEDLKKSYHEAVHAVEYANKIEEGQVIHIADIRDEEARREYPLKEKSAFLAAIRMGDRSKALEQQQKLPEMLMGYGRDRDTLLKIRIYELLGAVIEAAIAGGGDVEELLLLSEKLFAESTMIRSQTQLAVWLKSWTEEVVSIVAHSHSSRSWNIVRKAKQYIDEHFSEAISIKDVADAVCISESYLKSLFKKSSNHSYSEYLTNVRINQAKKLLRTTEKSITEIAMDVGYQTPNSFSALFKRETGMTPTQYKHSSPKVSSSSFIQYDK